MTNVCGLSCDRIFGPSLLLSLWLLVIGHLLLMMDGPGYYLIFGFWAINQIIPEINPKIGSNCTRLFFISLQIPTKFDEVLKINISRIMEFFKPEGRLSGIPDWTITMYPILGVAAQDKSPPQCLIGIFEFKWTTCMEPTII